MLKARSGLWHVVQERPSQNVVSMACPAAKAAGAGARPPSAVRPHPPLSGEVDPPESGDASEATAVASDDAPASASSPVEESEASALVAAASSAPSAASRPTAPSREAFVPVVVPEASGAAVDTVDASDAVEGAPQPATNSTSKCTSMTRRPFVFALAMRLSHSRPRPTVRARRPECWACPVHATARASHTYSSMIAGRPASRRRGGVALLALALGVGCARAADSEFAFDGGGGVEVADVDVIPSAGSGSAGKAGAGAPSGLPDGDDEGLPDATARPGEEAGPMPVEAGTAAGESETAPTSVDASVVDVEPPASTSTPVSTATAPEVSGPAPSASTEAGAPIAPVTCAQICASGCCNEAGQCVAGTADDACGVAGTSCQDCSTTGQTCQSQACAAPPAAPPSATVTPTAPTTAPTSPAPTPAPTCDPSACSNLCIPYFVQCCKDDQTCGCALLFPRGSCN